MFPFANRRTNYSIIEDEGVDEQEEESGDPSLAPAHLRSFPDAFRVGGGASSSSMAATSHYMPPPPGLLNPGDESDSNENDGDEGNMMTGGSGGGVPPSSHEVLNVSFDGQARGLTSRARGRASNLTGTHHHQMEILGGSSTKRDHRWDHIEDVDQFFTLVYEYHQGNGFACIALRHAFALFQFVAVVVFSTFLLQCVDYSVLFNNKNTTVLPVARKRTIQDAIIPSCPSTFPPLLLFALVLASLFWLTHLVRVVYRLLQLIEMRTFFSGVLQIPDAQLSDTSWDEVVQKLCQVQPDIHLIINQEMLSPLDVCQRILRFKNFFVALVYKGILPPQISVPFLGSVRYLSSGLRLNLEWLLFWGPWAPWGGRSSYSLKDEYRDKENLDALAVQLRRSIAWISLINLALFPFIFLYQILFSFFSYADLIKRDPTVFGTRKYSCYGKEKLRHFNELDHELNGRLNRSYEFAVRYMDQFMSPVGEIVAKTVAFTCGSIFAVLLLLSAWDEDVLNVEHVLTVMTVTGAVVVACRSFIPDEHIVLCQQFLMRHILAHIHYAPRSWMREASSSETYSEFSQLFQLRAQYLLEELLSPLITPFVLFFCVRPRAEEIVHFFHNQTRFIEGIGDVCSLAQMDITRDGDSRLASLSQSTTATMASAEGQHGLMQSDKRPLNAQQGRAADPHCGKIELSLLNFAAQHPSWSPPEESASFIATIRGRAAAEAPILGIDPLLQHGGTLRDLERSMRPLAQAQAQAESLIMAAQPNTSAVSASLMTSGQHHQASAPSEGPPPSFTAVNTANAPTMGTSQLQDCHTSSFIHPLPLAQLQPGRIAMRNARAMEMSRNTLALNRLLADNSAAMGASALFGVPRHSAAAPTASAVGSRYGTLTAAAAAGNLAGSNIWGVPSTSVMMSEEHTRESVFFPPQYTHNNL